MDNTNTRAFRLGRYHFKLANCPEDQLAEFDKIFPSSAVEAANVETLDLSSEDYSGVRWILNKALLYHKDCIWFDAAVVQTQSKASIMFAGASSSGKSTLATALSLTQHWKIIAEDIALIDPDSDSFVVFASPFSMKAGTVERLARTIGSEPGPVVLGEWIPLNSLSCEGPVSAYLDFAFIMQPISPQDSGPLKVEPISSGSATTLLLPISNLLRVDGALEGVANYLSRARCFRLSGGELNERLSCVIELCQQVS